MINLLIILTIFCPLFFWVGVDLRSSQETFYQLICTMIATSLLFFNIKPIKRNPVNIGMAIFGIYTVILFLLGGANRGASEMMNTFVAMMLYFAVLQVKKEDTHKLLKAIIWVAVINMIYIGLQLVNFDFIFNIRGIGNTILFDAIDPIGFFGIKAVMGIWMALGAIATLLINPILSVCFLVPLWMSRCTGAIMGLTAGMLFYFLWIKRKLFYILLPVIILGALGYIIFVDSPMGMMGTRPPMWKMVMKDVVYGYNLKEPRVQSPYLRNIFTGFGLDSFRNGPIVYFKIVETNETVRGIRVNNNVFNEKGEPYKIDSNGSVYTPDGRKTDVWAEAHCAFIQLFYEMGLIGMGIFLFILYHLKERFKNAVKSKELVTITSLIVCLLFCMLTQFPERVSRTAYLIPLLLGLFTNLTSEEG